MSDSLKYDLRGVSANKEEVHAAIKSLDKGLYPNAFCKILPDIVAGDSNYCNVMHADTAGTKTALAYLYWKESGDLNVWKGIAQDAMVMNLDDMGCVGITDNIMLSSTIGRNKNLISGDVIATIINACTEFIESMKAYGVNIHLTGGETADVGDIVRTIDVGYTTFGRIQRNKVLENKIKAGNVIIGVASYGQATYEQDYNSGIGSNGLTSGRHDTLCKALAKKYPDSFDSNVPSEVVYTGKYMPLDPSEKDGFTIGQLLLSPTRTYLPLLKSLFDEYSFALDGVIHCTGGAQTKVLHFIEGLNIIKDNLLETPEVFKMIQASSNTDWKEMYQVFNMGHRLELYVDEKHSKSILDLIQSFNLEAKIIGRVEESSHKMVTLSSEYGSFVYS
tara:strand:- start:219 stop:1388 length:1170 start_codon:yes stop_codon:yes gene_type:complete